MEQLFCFADLPSIDIEELEGKIDPRLDEAFLSEVAAAFAARPDSVVEIAEADAA
jgi:hypothetical protein